MRMTGRAAQMLFGSDQTQSILAWHSPNTTARLRLAGTDEAIVLPQVDLLSLLHLTLPVQQITTLSAWVEDFIGIEQVMKLLDPWLTTQSRAIIRMPQTALPAMLRRLPVWPARCAAVLPCTYVGDGSSAAEAVIDVIVCFEDISAQSPHAAGKRMETTPRALLAETWNEKLRSQRGKQSGGVNVRLPTDRSRPASALAVTLLGDAPATLAGASFAAMQTRPFQPSIGFDYLLDVSAATITSEHETLFVVPQRGPVIVDPARLPGADAAGMSPEEMRQFLTAHGVERDGRFFAGRKSPIEAVASRPTFLLSATANALDHVTQSWPNLQHLFELCDRERMVLADIDVLIPGADRFVIDSLLLSGIAPAQLRFSFDGVLYRRLLVANPASQAASSQRSPIYDRFWAQRAEALGRASFVSFSQPKPSGKVLLVDPLAAPIVNGATLQAMARDRGYQVIAPASAGMAELIAALAAAWVVVGPSALLGWSCLAPAGALGLLHASNETALPYPALHAAAARGHSIIAMFGSSIGAASNAPFVVAPDRFTALLDRVEAGASSRRTRAEAEP
jgi:hypothetical protein